MSLRRFLKRRWWDAEREREIASYMEMEIAENIARGMTPADAAAAARRRFGNQALVREEIYQMNTIAWLESLWQDLRYSARQLRLSPGFTLVAILSLALGMGANTAIFQLLDAVRLRALPIARPDELAEIRIIGGNRGMGLNNGPYAQLTTPLWQEIRAHQKAFSGVFAWGIDDVMIGRGPEMRRAKALDVSGEFFPVLGVKPWRGRLLDTSDADGPCPESNAVVSYAYWQTEMGGREIGPDSKVVVDGEMGRIIGVTPPGFTGLVVGDSFDIAMPFCRPNEVRRDVFDISVMGRLRPGWTPERASAQLSAMSPGIFEEVKPSGYSAQWMQTWSRFRLGVYPASQGVSQLRTHYDSSLWLLLAMTGLVLLIACANVANLMLARASTRTREIAVRLALGASRTRLIRQLLAESGLLALAGFALAIVLAKALSRVLVWALSTEGNAVFFPVDTDWRVLAFAGAVATVTCALFGLMPALRATSAEPVTAMKVGRTRLDGGPGALLHAALPGGDPDLRFAGAADRRTAVRAQLPQPGHVRSGHSRAGDYGSVRQLPSVEPAARALRRVQAAIGGGVALNARNTRCGHHNQRASSRGELDPYRPRRVSRRLVEVHLGKPEIIFTLWNLPLLAGRGFNQNDISTSQHVAVVNQTFVRRFLGSANPLGRTLRTMAEPNYPSTVYEIVGVIPDTKYNNLRDADAAR